MMDELQAVFRSTYHDSSDRLTGSEFPAPLEHVIIWQPLFSLRGGLEHRRPNATENEEHRDACDHDGGSDLVRKEGEVVRDDGLAEKSRALDFAVARG